MLALSFKELERLAQTQTEQADALQKRLLELQDRNAQLDTLLKARRARVADLEISLQAKTELAARLEQENERLAGDLEISSGLVTELRESATQGAAAKSIIAKLQGECAALHEQVGDLVRIRSSGLSGRPPPLTELPVNRKFRLTISASAPVSVAALVSEPGVPVVDRSVQTLAEFPITASSCSSDSDSFDELLRSSGLRLEGRPRRRRTSKKFPITVPEPEPTQPRRAAQVVTQGSQTRRPFLEISLSAGYFENFRSASRAAAVQTRAPEAPRQVQTAVQSEQGELRVERQIGNFVSRNFRSLETDTACTQTVAVICATRGSQCCDAGRATTAEISVQTETARKTEAGVGTASGGGVAALEISGGGGWEVREEERLQALVATARQVSVQSERIAEKYQQTVARLEQISMEKEDARNALLQTNAVVEQLIDRAIAGNHDRKTALVQTEKFPTAAISVSTEKVEQFHAQTQCRPAETHLVARGCNTEIPKNFRSPLAVEEGVAEFVVSEEAVASSSRGKRGLAIDHSLAVFRSPRVKIDQPAALLNAYTTGVQTEQTGEETRKLREEISVQRTNFQVKLRGVEQTHRLELERLKRETSAEIGNLKTKHEDEVRTACSKVERKFQLRQEKRIDLVPILEKIGKNFAPLHFQEEISDPISRRILQLFLQVRAEAFAKGRQRSRKFLTLVRGFLLWRVACVTARAPRVQAQMQTSPDFRASDSRPAASPVQEAPNLRASDAGRLPRAMAVVAAQAVHWEAQLRREMVAAMHRAISSRK